MFDGFLLRDSINLIVSAQREQQNCFDPVMLDNLEENSMDNSSAASTTSAAKKCKADLLCAISFVQATANTPWLSISSVT